GRLHDDARTGSGKRRERRGRLRHRLAAARRPGRGGLGVQDRTGGPQSRGAVGVAMSDANVEIAKRVIDAFNRRDVDTIFECVNPDVEWFPAMSVTFGGGLRGREGIEAYVREVSDTWRSTAWPGRTFATSLRTRFSSSAGSRDAERAAV